MDTVCVDTATRHRPIMAIQSFRCADTQALFELRRVPRWVNAEAPALKKLRLLHAARQLVDLRTPPGNRLEYLKDGKRAGRHSIRINDQWRICFVWTADGPADVEIFDYH